MSEHLRMLKKQYKYFKHGLKNQKIEDYYGFSYDNRKLSICVNKCKDNNSKYMVKINYIKPQPFVNIVGLPLEMAKEIHQYVKYEYIKLTFCIEYPIGYPFIPPIWSVDKISHSVNTQLNLTEYYNYIVDNHNTCYQLDWSPAMKLESDLIVFLIKINHFDMIFEYN